MPVGYVTVKLPIKSSEGLGGFHQELCAADFPNGDKVKVSAGFGLGSTEMYVSLNGKRVLTVDGEPLLRALIDRVVHG